MTFVPFFCWYGPEFIPVYVFVLFLLLNFIKLYLNFDVINLITV
jgi:hypothetical protein